MKKNQLGDELIRRGLVSPQNVAAALERQDLLGDRLGTSLLELDLIEESDLLATLGELAGTETASTEHLKSADRAARAALPVKVARRYRVVPLALHDKVLTIATVDPPDVLLEDEIGFLTRCRVRSLLALEVRVVQGLEAGYGLPSPVRMSALFHRLDRPKASIPEAPATSPPVQIPTWEPSPLLPSQTAPRPPRTMEIEISAEDQALLGLSTVSAPVQPRLEPGRVESEELPADPAGRLDACADLLQHAELRDEVADSVLAFCAPYFRRRVLLVARGDSVVGWAGEGEGLSRRRVRKISVAADQPSIFAAMNKPTSFWRGRLPELPSNLAVISGLGDTGLVDDCVVAPISLRGRVVAWLYCDNLSDGVEAAPLTELGRLAQKAGVAFQVYLLKNKIRTL